MEGPAYVNSLSAVQDFRNALVMYVAESKQGIATLETEIRRAFDWIAIDRAGFWKNEIRRAMDALARARDELHNARTFKSIGDYTPSCVDEQKAVRRAEERLKMAEAKAETVKKWTRSLQHELNEYIGRMAQFTAVLEGDLPKAMSTLDRVLGALDNYLSTKAPKAMAEPHSGNAGETGSMAMPLPLDEREPAAENTTEQTNPPPAAEPAAAARQEESDVNLAAAQSVVHEEARS